ncbi:beta-carotene 15,15'-monooxygenase [Lysinibacillus irui]|uniref:Beta-carotene 15,15'-monooxygenase n=1 Tax=Lysinibacillus irui TaxID=2998077 RepID=A0ABU5NK61_9BACI|nr:beta-carotene 15,15'-monooxygenase [Lysinibacillus irui]MEA0554717.1 beta-carotene 15,15'-monooxygenase [Lysinibacillus irui]MEA0976432.1 beta-carotene 15,15'-monooxygenase [Lysinibacillus irui]MEA1042586.1 beta-carotene 15,15'-monooxygenase [Lysinibacillus irui]
MIVLKRKQNIWLALLLLVLASNFTLYHSGLGSSILPLKTNGVVMGSLFDFVVVMPVLYMLYKGKFSLKQAILLAAFGCIAARFFIPMEHLQPFVAVTWAGFAVEGTVILLEIVLVATLVRYLPSILKDVRESSLPDLFSFSKAVEKHAPKHPVIQMICADLLVLYYSFASWRRKEPQGLTLHKQSSYIAFQLMIIHGIAIETIGIHWWLHEKSMILSIVLLIFNLYSVIFFIADMQAIRLNPVYVTEDTLYLSLGLMKRTEVRFAHIAEMVEDKGQLEGKLSKDTIDFIARDFGEAYPQFILKMKEPVEVTFMLGIKKHYNQVAIKADQVQEFRQMLEKGMSKHF